MLLRIDDIVSGQKTQKKAEPPTSRMEEGNPNSALEGEGDQI